jgi:hypothetical protein
VGGWKVLALCGAYLTVGTAVLWALHVTGGPTGLLILCTYIAIGLALVSAVRVGHLGRWAVVMSTSLSMGVLIAFFAWMIAVDRMIDEHAQPVVHFVVLFGGVVILVTVIRYLGYRIGLWSTSGEIVKLTDGEDATQRAEPGDRRTAR